MKTNKTIRLASALCLCLALVSTTVTAQGEQYLYSIPDDGMNQLVKIDPSNGEIETVGPLGLTVNQTGVDFSCDGTLHAFSVLPLEGRSALYTVNLDTGEADIIQYFTKVPGVGLEFGPDGETLFLRVQSELYTLNVETGELDYFDTLWPDRANNLAMPPDCKGFFSRSGTSQTFPEQYLTRIEIDMVNKKAEVTEQKPIGKVYGSAYKNLAAAPDGTLYSIFELQSDPKAALYVIDPETGYLDRRGYTGGYIPNSLAYGPEAVCCAPCPDTVVIDGCDTGVFAPLADGTCLQDVVDDCAAGVKNHGSYVSCVARAMAELVQEGLLTGREKGLIVSCAAQSDIGKK